jgi:MtN3 and saliva related transmembrane protein
MYYDIIGYIGGAISSISLIFQVYKTFQQKSGKDLSWWMLIINLVGCLLIATYAVLIEKPAIYSTISLTIICFVILMAMKLHYDKDKKMNSNTDMV